MNTSLSLLEQHYTLSDGKHNNNTYWLERREPLEAGRFGRTTSTGVCPVIPLYLIRGSNFHTTHIMKSSSLLIS